MLSSAYPFDKVIDGCVCGAVFEGRCETVPGRFSYYSIIRYLRAGEAHRHMVYHIGQKAYVTACWKRHTRRCNEKASAAIEAGTTKPVKWYNMGGG